MRRYTLIGLCTLYMGLMAGEGFARGLNARTQGMGGVGLLGSGQAIPTLWKVFVTCCFYEVVKSVGKMNNLLSFNDLEQEHFSNQAKIAKITRIISNTNQI